jgi:hypothetical protein
MLCLLLLVACCILLVSCATKKELAEKVEMGMSMEEVRGLLGAADADLGSGETIDMYVLNGEGEVAILSYQMDSEGTARVSHIYVGVLPADSPYWNYLQ